MLNIIQLFMKQDIDTCSDVEHDEDKIERIRNSFIDDEKLSYILNIINILNDYNRLKIIHALYISELCVQEIASVVGLSQSATSHQLRILRDNKIVKFRKEKKHVYYSLLNKEVIKSIDLMKEEHR